MDQRAAIPVEPPKADPSISYWQDPPDLEVADFVSSNALPETVDIVIIGSGITGTSIAYNLLSNPSKPSGKLLMLEARQACSGATGRNGGHTKAASYRSFLDNARNLSVSLAVKIAKFEYDTIRSLHAFARQQNIDCDLYSGDTVDIIYDKAQWTQALTAIEAIRQAMPDDLMGAARYKFWREEEAREKFYVKGERFEGAVSYEAGSLSAYKFVIGVLKICLKKGLELYTNTTVQNVEREGEGWLVKTSKGMVRARRVVLATNGYTASLFRRFQGAIVPLRGQVTAHRPGRGMPKSGLGVTYSFIYGDGYDYMIPRPKGTRFDSDIVIGGGLARARDEGLEEFGMVDDTSLNPEISVYLYETAQRYFGESWGEDHEDGRIRKEWTGIMGYSPDGFPFIGEVPEEKGLWIAASFQGHGMVLCFSSAKALVAMMNGEENSLDSWFPEVFKVTEERIRTPFAGKLHMKPIELEKA